MWLHCRRGGTVGGASVVSEMLGDWGVIWFCNGGWRAVGCRTTPTTWFKFCILHRIDFSIWYDIYDIIITTFGTCYDISVLLPFSPLHMVHNKKPDVVWHGDRKWAGGASSSLVSRNTSFRNSTLFNISGSQVFSAAGCLNRCQHSVVTQCSKANQWQIKCKREREIRENWSDNGTRAGNYYQ